MMAPCQIPVRSKPGFHHVADARTAAVLVDEPDAHNFKRVGSATILDVCAGFDSNRYTQILVITTFSL